MDEPTSVLTPAEVEKLFVTLRRLAAEGCSILYISHKLEEVRALCSAGDDHAAGPQRRRLHAGREDRQGTGGDHDQHGSARADAPRPPPAAAPRRGWCWTRLTVRSPHQFGTDLNDISLSLAGGEILGIAGIAGNGQSELMDALSGEIPAGRPETILIDGVAAGHMGPQERRRSTAASCRRNATAMAR